MQAIQRILGIIIADSVKSIGADAFYWSNNDYYDRPVYITDLEAWCRIDFANPSANPLYWGCGYLYINNYFKYSINHEFVFRKIIK